MVAYEMIIPGDITIGVVFSSSRDCNITEFFSSCFNDPLSKQCNFLVIDNACTFDLREKIKEFFRKRAFRPTIHYVRNEQVESLPYNHNLIYFTSSTNYIIHNNDEVYFRKDWLTKSLDWINKPENEGRICHLSRCSKGYNKEIIKKIGYFNLYLKRKDASDSDIEFREYKYLENPSVTQEWWKANGDGIVISKMIGSWKQEFFYPVGCVSWMSDVIVQPGDPNFKMNDSNLWLTENLSENNTGYSSFSDVGRQGLEDISEIYKDKKAIDLFD